jgi:hypothetical protein
MVGGRRSARGRGEGQSCCPTGKRRIDADTYFHTRSLGFGAQRGEGLASASGSEEMSLFWRVGCGFSLLSSGGCGGLGFNAVSASEQAVVTTSVVSVGAE